MNKQNPISRSGRFQKGPGADARNFSESVSFDWQLYPQDIAVSIAHAKMLAKQKILTQRESSQITRGLQRIKKEIQENKFVWNSDLEDVHMNIEATLTRRVPAAAKLHTARSRNDQVATDMRLWIKNEAQHLKQAIHGLQKSLLKLAEKTRIHSKKTGDTFFLPIPGYTHLQRAQPVLAAHHLLAYVEMLQRDDSRFSDCIKRADISPLGSGAIAGTSLSIDRNLTARLLNFREASANSMDAVSDRDFVAEFLFTCALTGIHLSRLAEDFILWSSTEFSFITIGDSYTTGSSLMPQKKNPDIAELGRGKSGRLIGNLVSILTLLKGLPMTYNRDLQEDKEPMFDSAKTLSTTLFVFAGMVQSTSFNTKTCLHAASDPNLLATEVADYLVRQGMPFRKAHHLVGSAVHLAEKNNLTLADLTLSQWQKIHPIFKKDIAQVFKLSRFFSSRQRLKGAPSISHIEAELSRWKKILEHS